MTTKQVESVIKKFNDLSNFLKLIQEQPYVKNKMVVKEVRFNIESEIERLISLERDDEEENFNSMCDPISNFLAL